MRSFHILAVVLGFAAVVIAAVGAPPPASAAIVSITTIDGPRDGLLTRAGHQGTRFSPMSVPVSESHTVVDGGNANTTTYDFNANSLEIAFDHSVDSLGLSAAMSSGSFWFSVDEDSDFVLSGGYSLVDPDGRAVEMRLSITYVTGPASPLFSLYESLQISRSTPNEHFVLGQEGGDYLNIPEPPSLGTLIAGQQYLLGYEFSAVTYPAGASSGATATGNFKLTLVPEPSSALLIGLGLTLLGHRPRPRT